MSIIGSIMLSSIGRRLLFPHHSVMWWSTFQLKLRFRLHHNFMIKTFDATNSMRIFCQKTIDPMSSFGWLFTTYSFCQKQKYFLLLHNRWIWIYYFDVTRSTQTELAYKVFFIFIPFKRWNDLLLCPLCVRMQLLLPPLPHYVNHIFTFLNI